MATALAAQKVEWNIVAEEVVSCNCDGGCPCQFSSLPSNRFCEALAALDIERGHYGETNLVRVPFALEHDRQRRHTTRGVGVPLFLQVARGGTAAAG